MAVVFPLSLAVPKGHTSSWSQVCFGSKKISILLTQIHSWELHLKWMHQRYLKRRKHIPREHDCNKHKASVHSTVMKPATRHALSSPNIQHDINETLQHFSLWWFAKPHVKVHYLAPNVDRQDYLDYGEKQREDEQINIQTLQIRSH